MRNVVGLGRRRNAPVCPSTGSALHLACNGMNSCDPGSNVRCGCCAALGKIVRGRSPGGCRFIIPTGLGSLCGGGSFKHCTVGGNRVPVYFIAKASGAKNGSNSPIFGGGKRLVNANFSHGCRKLANSVTCGPRLRHTTYISVHCALFVVSGFTKTGRLMSRVAVIRWRCQAAVF